MNKTYKTIWNYSSGEWVAASELAKGHGKSSSKLGKAALALAVTVSSISGAYAATNISGGTSASPAPQQIIADTEVNINVGGGTNTGYFKSTTGTVITVTGTGDTKVTAENININASNTAAGSYSTAMSITGSAGSQLQLKGNNTLTLDATSGDTGVIVSTAAGSGDAKLTVEGTLTLNNNANWRGFENDGLEANAGSGGSAIITHTGTGTISVAGGHAIQARANSAGRDVQVTLNSSAGKDAIQLISMGSSGASAGGSSAIGAKGSSASGKVTVNTNAKITTTGTDAHGIYATSAGKAADGQTIYIDNSGTISTSGADSHGIYSKTTATTANGTTTIKNSGNITTTNVRSNAILHDITNNGQGVEITNSGNLTTSGNTANAVTVNAIDPSVTDSGKITINLNDSAIKTTGNSAHGVYIHTKAEQGDIEVNLKDTVMSLDGSNSDGIGIFQTNTNLAQRTQTNIVVNTSGGSITTLDNATAGGGANYGIVVYQDGNADGNITINNVGTDITTKLGTNGLASGSDAIYAGFRNNASGATGDVKVTNTGALSTQGGNSVGIRATNNGSGKINVDNDANIITAGASSHGIHTQATTGETSIRVGADSIITTQGQNAMGIYARTTGGGLIDIYNDGQISTQGNNSVGISAANNGSGKVNVENNARITTAGATSHGINTVASAGETSIRVNADSSITTQGQNAMGIYANATGGGLIDIYNAGQISTQDTTGTTNTTGVSYAIYALQSTGGSSSGMNISVEDTTLSTKNYDATGIRAATYASSGDVDITVKNTEINLDGNDADGILAQKVAGATTASDLDLNITVTDSAINVLKNPSLAGNGSMNFGIAAMQHGAAAGNINIINSNTDITVGKGMSGNTSNSGAIYAVYSSVNATGHIDIQNDGNLTSDSSGSMGVIYASNAGSGDVKVMNLGHITANGDGASGIYASSGNGGNVTIDSTGDIALTKTTHTATKAVGITAIANNGGDAIVNVSGHISVMGDSSTTSTPTMIAIDASSNQGQTSVNFSNGLIEAYTTAIKVSDNGSALGTQGTINLGPNAIVHSTSGYAVEAWVTGGNKINIDETSVIQGKQGIYILSGNTARNEINNWGLIDVGQDIAIKDDSTLGSETVVNNWGTIIGQYSFGAGSHVTVNNYSHNSINLRNFTDSDGDGVRDTHGVAVLDHGVGGSAILNNDATGTVRLALVSNEINIDDTGEYVPVGALSINNQGIAHGHILNLNEFSNAGLIELSNNKLAGDVLVITGGATAGVAGTGAYVSNSGRLSVDTQINQGGAASLSDVLVVDNVRMGTGATMVHVNPTANGAGGLTQNDGIKIIEVLGTQDANAFELAAPVSYGAYDYLLMQGTAQRSNWFLRNNANGKIFYNPAVGAYLGNQYAASTMFNHNILDRRDNVRAPDQTIWGRINYSDLKTDLFDGSAETKIDSYLMQFGVDILKRNDWVAGAYIGYGHSDIDNKSTITNVSADGKVKGYQIGAYASWMPQKNKGPYLDLWGHVARYSNDLSGATGKGDYDSTGYALSIEGGHAFELGKSDDGKAWILEPHAQLIYNYLNADDFSMNNTRYHGNDSSGIQTRLGARFYMQRAGGHDGVVPFIEANWLGNYTSNKVKANNDKVSTDIGENVGELKLGLQGKLNNWFSVWGHLGGQVGSESYRRYEAQFGLGYEW